MPTSLDIGARRVYRLSLTVAVSLAAGYGLALQIPFLAPIFAFVLAAAPKPPMGFRGVVGTALVLSLTLGVGLLLTPVLIHYPVTGLMLVLLGVFFSNYISLNMGKGLVGTLLTVGIALISVAGLIAPQVATSLIAGMVVGIVVAVVCHRLVYPFFPEDTLPAAAPAPPVPARSSWLALRATLIVYPAFMLALFNPTLYLPVIMKSLALGQQASAINARDAGRELLGSTVMGGMFAALFWAGLSVAPTLWMFFMWMLLFAIFITAKFYGVLSSRYPPSYWQNALVTLLILLGPAVADSANGKDVYTAFAVRMGLFILVTIYAWLAVVILDRLYTRRRQGAGGTMPSVVAA